MTAPATRRPPWLLALALVAVSINLRAVIASVPPLVDTIEADLHLSSAWSGALTTLPVLCMGLFAPLAARLGRRVGPAGAVQLATVGVVVGCLLRLAGAEIWTLYVGTFVAGVGIAIAGTLLPSLVKELFPPQRAGLVTGLYMLSMMGGAALSSALAVPFSHWLGSWEASLASWSLLGLVGALAWLPVSARERTQRATFAPPDDPHRLPWRHLTAWAVAAYLGVQSWQFYSSLAWVAPSYVAHGWAPSLAGYLLAAFTLAQLVSGLVGPVLTDRVRDRRLLLLPVGLLGTVGMSGLAFAPEAAPWAWVVILGLGQGAAFSLGLVLLVDYAETPSASGRLAAMCFFVSYTVASFGPATMGAVRDAASGFHTVWLALLCLMAVQLGLALLLGPHRDRIA
ncbi:MFS transporter [Segeticoccus rhizosphaerae]|uniref:MFS transporter n=1 Tax=Segeticoccus rhizosphaerae TaxID=1104777 RepID=UPI0010C02E7E|nr:MULTISPECIES: MFS transporter [Intrasporangiaceae]